MKGFEKMAHLIIQGVFNSFRDPQPGSACYINISFMGGTVNVRVSEVLLPELRQHIGQQRNFVLNTFFRVSLLPGRKKEDSLFIPSELVEIRNLK